ARAHRRDQTADLFVRQHLLHARLLDVEDLAAQREDRLEAAVTAGLRGAARGISLDEVQLTLVRVALRAVGELAGQHRAIEQALANDEIARLPRSLACPRRHDALL